MNAEHPTQELAQIATLRALLARLTSPELTLGESREVRASLDAFLAASPTEPPAPNRV